MIWRHSSQMPAPCVESNDAAGQGRPRRRAVPADECERPCLTPRGYPRRSGDCRCDIFLSQKIVRFNLRERSSQEVRQCPKIVRFLSQSFSSQRGFYSSLSRAGQRAPTMIHLRSSRVQPPRRNPRTVSPRVQLQRLSTPQIRWSGSASSDDHSLGARTRARGPLFVLARRQALALP